MTMHVTLTESMFIDAMQGDYSLDACRALFEYLDDQCGEFDAGHIRGWWSEYDNALEAAQTFRDYYPDEDETDEDEREAHALEWLRRDTTVLLCGRTSDCGVIIKDN